MDFSLNKNLNDEINCSFTAIFYKGQMYVEDLVELSLKITKLWHFKENTFRFYHNFFRRCLSFNISENFEIIWL